jgi:tRNA/tmRNA/rRNA uracil-C5-methylase (TrmA/RlmC/RlmD family)
VASRRRKVVGIDVSEEAVAWAKAKHQLDNLEFFASVDAALKEELTAQLGTRIAKQTDAGQWRTRHSTSRNGKLILGPGRKPNCSASDPDLLQTKTVS